MLVMISESLTIFPLTASKKEYRDHLLLLIGLIYCFEDYFRVSNHFQNVANIDGPKFHHLYSRSDNFLPTHPTKVRT